MKSALILGGSGFLGSALTTKLLAENFAVFTFSRSGHTTGLNHHHSLKGDFQKSEDRQIILDLKFDYIFHLVSSSTPSSQDLSYCEDLQSNVLPTISYLENLNPEGLSNFVFISSGGAVYGDSQAELTENSPTLPLSSYGVCKVTLENYVRLLSDRRGFRATILRPTNPYGLWQQGKKPFGFINNLLDKCLRGESFGVVEGGRIARDFIHIDDLTTAILSVMDLKQSFDIFNISADHCISLSEVLEICKNLGIEPQSLHSFPLRAVDPKMTKVSSQKLRTVTNWSPAIPLREGILKTYEELKSRGGK